MGDSVCSNEIDKLTSGAVLLSPDNFTPLSCTPWAGRYIVSHYKNKILRGRRMEKIGESWDFSCEPSLPSKVLEHNMTLAELVSLAPGRIFGEEWLRNNAVPSMLLVKMLNSHLPLSVQVHAHEGYSRLKESEGGKAEAWLILHAEPGAGLFLGLSKPQSIEELRMNFKQRPAAEKLLHFTEVKAGDYFEIPPGTIHAIGSGVTLLEPQWTESGKIGKTYRFWDWDRKYSLSGEIDMENGQPRETHLEECLDFIDPKTQLGNTLVQRLRKIPKDISNTSGAKILSFPENEHFQLFHISLRQGKTFSFSLSTGYGALIMLEGLVLSGRNSAEKITLVQGQPALLPFSAFPVHFRAEEDSQFALVIPAKNKISTQ